MTQEKEGGTPVDVGNTQPTGRERIPKYMFFHEKRLKRRKERGEINEERESAKEDSFGLDLERIDDLDNINRTLMSSSIDSRAQYLDYPHVEDLLNQYFSIPDDDTLIRKQIRLNLSKGVEIGIKNTFRNLTSDIRKLHMDRGETEESSIAAVDEFVNHTTIGKKRHFGQIEKNEQLDILNLTLELRNQLLRENMGHYLFYLTAYKSTSEVTDDEITERRRIYETLNEEQQLTEAAKARKEAEIAMSKSFTVNSDRLRDLAQLEGVSQEDITNEIYNLRVAFEMGSLPQKSKAIEKINSRKIDLVVPYLDDVIELRMELENRFPEDSSEKFPHDNVGDNKDTLENEVNRIEKLLFKLLSSRGFGQENASIDDVRQEIDYIAKKTNIPTLKSTFERVSPLRTVLSNFFEF